MPDITKKILPVWKSLKQKFEHKQFEAERFLTKKERVISALYVQGEKWINPLGLFSSAASFRNPDPESRAEASKKWQETKAKEQMHYQLAKKLSKWS